MLREAMRRVRMPHSRVDTRAYARCADACRLYARRLPVFDRRRAEARRAASAHAQRIRMRLSAAAMPLMRATC